MQLVESRQPRDSVQTRARQARRVCAAMTLRAVRESSPLWTRAVKATVVMDRRRRRTRRVVDKPSRWIDCTQTCLPTRRYSSHAPASGALRRHPRRVGALVIPALIAGDGMRHERKSRRMMVAAVCREGAGCEASGDGRQSQFAAAALRENRKGGGSGEDGA